MIYSHRSYQPPRPYWDICKSKGKMLPQRVFQLQNSPQHLLCDLPTLLHRGKKGWKPPVKRLFLQEMTAEVCTAEGSWYLQYFCHYNSFENTCFYKWYKRCMVLTCKLSAIPLWICCCTTAATRVANAYLRRKILKRQDRSQRCHQLCHIVTVEPDPAADKKDFLCSSDTKVIPWTQLTDFQNFQIFILIYQKTILNNRPD